MNFDELKKILKESGEPGFRYRQIKDAFCKQAVLRFDEIRIIPKKLAGDLEGKISPLSFSLEKIVSAKNKLSYKALFRLDDGLLIESVLISAISGTWSACLSSQVGCQLACRFCATGQNGFKRNLTSEEITDQVIFWKNFVKTNNLPGTFSHIVFMGMGEPFLNWTEVKAALNRIISPDYFDFGARHISVSTSGIATGIKDLAREFPQVNLAFSLVFPDNKQRDEYMPVNRRFNLEDMRKAIEYYIEVTNRKVFLEYIMLAGVNDQRNHADKICDFIDSIENGAKLLHVNLISYNSTNAEFKSSDAKTVKNFLNFLQRNHVSATIRKSLGEEIDGACGQLAGQAN